jgi:integrase
VLGARWSEIDLAERVWTIPAGRMKAGKEHRVPLSTAAVEILHGQAAVRPEGDEDGCVFPGQLAEKPLSNMAMLKVLERMKRADLTVHGFRSTFRDWAGEATHHPREVIEHALAHRLKDKAEAAYQRGDLFEKRRVLMADWAAFLEKKPASVTQLRAAEAQA